MQPPTLHNFDPRHSADHLRSSYDRYRLLLTTTTLPYLQNGAPLLAQVEAIHDWHERCSLDDLPALCAALDTYIPFHPYKEYRYRHHIKILALAVLLRLCHAYPHAIDVDTVYDLSRRLIAGTRNNSAVCYTVSLRHFIKAASDIWKSRDTDFARLLDAQKEFYSQLT